MPTLGEIFPDPQQLLALQPEELAGVLIEIGDFRLFKNLKAQVFSSSQGGDQTGWLADEVELALAEALSWLETQGIIVRHPHTSGVYLFTRQGRALKTRTDLE